jgi:hypothetical protein
MESRKIVGEMHSAGWGCKPWPAFLFAALRRRFFPLKPSGAGVVREGMNGEWKLRDDAPPPVINRTRWLVFVGVIFGMLLVCSVTFALVVRTKASQSQLQPQTQTQPHDPNKPVGLKIFDGKATFAIKHMWTAELRLPCSGLLTVSLTFPKGTTLCAFLVPPEEIEKMKAGQTFKHVEGFDVKSTSGSCQQAGEVDPGRYSLVLLDESMSRSAVEVRAHLSNLK